ncbi:MAG: hypothetical protein GEU90_01310 [Gemmatimonas sp.]|nr:hypothetical protein [Gemmatimonas sp.]
MKFGRRATITAFVVGLLIVLVGGRAIAGFAAELLWYRSVGFEDVFWTQWQASLLVRGIIAIVIAAAVLVNLWFVTRSLGTIRVRRRYANIEIAERLPQVYIVSAISIVAFFSAWWLSAGIGDPLTVLAALNPESWNLADPVFGRDASFYVFRLPILNRLQTLGALLVFWVALLAAAAYVATGAIKLSDGRPGISTLARRHLGLLLAVFLLLYALNLWLDRYGLVVDGTGFAGALGYTDVYARMPAKLVVFLLAVAAAAAISYGAWVGNVRIPIAGAILLFLGLVSAEAIYPSSVQRFVVEPNEFPREQRFIERHLEFTRHAFGLNTLNSVPLPYQDSAEVDEDVLVRRLSGVPLWDPRPLLTAYRQRQGLFRYYTFASVHHDRYGSGAEAEPLAISVRELEVTELEEAAQTWQNLHLNYVAGAGAVVSPVATMAPDGTPSFYVSDLDPPKLAPEAPGELKLENPRIYFGERTNEYVILPAAAEAVGITLDSAWKKALFAWAFQSKNILLSGDLTRDSKIVYQRGVAERVQAVAPFLRVSADGAALPVIHEGRVVWMVDAYTTSPSFPLAPLVAFEERGVRYIRNSVKATVDAVTGEVALYAVDPSDPVLATYSRLFPDLFRPIDGMPKALQEHLRYPAQFMHLQAQVLGAYHLTDPRAFYGQQDVWSVADEQYRGTVTSMEPTYAMYPLPGSAEPEFLLSVPFVARGRQNMTALLVARNDPPNYGEQILFMLPRDELIPGPEQIEAMIDQDPEISQQLSLWRTGGSNVLRGHLMIVPVEGSLIYVEPLFLEAENTAIPQLERVILARPGQVVMSPTFESAVTALLGGQTGGTRLASTDRDETEGADQPSIEVEGFARARQLMQEADRLLRSGDWAGFGRTWESLREALGPGAENL